MTVLSIGMIVKNEAKNLRRTLEALQPLLKAVKGQLIIADTGSEDETIEIAKEFTKEVFSIPWENDFAKARNATLIRARGEWFFYLDADEVLTDPKELIRFFNSPERKKYGSISISIKNCLSEQREVWTQFTSPRLFRCGDNIRFEGAIHEHAPVIMPIYYLQQTHLMHYGYNNDDAAFLQRKAERNLAIMEQMLQADNFADDFARAKFWIDYSDSLKMAGTEECDKKSEQSLENAIAILWDISDLENREMLRYCFLARAYSSLMAIWQAKQQWESICERGEDYLQRQPKRDYWDLDIFFFLADAVQRKGDEEKAAEYRGEYIKWAEHEDSDIARYIILVSQRDEVIKQARVVQALYYHDHEDNDKAWETIKDVNAQETNRETMIFQWQLAMDNDIANRLPYLYPHMPEEHKDAILQAIADVIDGATDARRQDTKQGLLQVQDDKDTWSLLALCANDEAEMQSWLAEIDLQDLTAKRGGQLLWRCIEQQIPLGFLAGNIEAYCTSCAEAHWNLPYEVYVYYQNSDIENLNQLELKAAQYLLCHCTFMMEVNPDIFVTLWRLALQYGLRYMELLYKPEILQSVAEILSPLERFLLYTQQALDIKAQGEYNRALTILKQGLNIYPSGQHVVKLLTEEIEDLANPIGAEMKRLAANVKTQIRTLIDDGFLDEAANLIDELSAIVPDDADIPYLLEQTQPPDIIWN